MKSGKYIIEIKAYEKDYFDSITNQGTLTSEINVKQLAQNLEIIIENSEVEPGTTLKAKVILHDQSGENIPINATIKIQDNKNILLEKIQTSTDQEFEFHTTYNQAPAKYKIIATATEIQTDSFFTIKEKQLVEANIVNNTLIIKNKGNVPYCNKTILVKIGNESVNVNVCLGIDEETKYKLTAPDGEYNVEVITDEEKFMI